LKLDEHLAYFGFFLQVFVNRTVDFDDQLRFNAIEVNDELAYGMLPSEPISAEAPGSQTVP
jgi:hypothetical protein